MSGNNEFFPVEFADQLVADNEKLAKGSALGKWVAKNRRVFIWLSFSVLALSLVGLGFIVVQGVIPSMRLAAAGIVYRFGETELSGERMRLPNFKFVERVLQPTAFVTDTGHALLVLTQLDQKPPPLQPDDVKRGYHQWVVSAQESRPHNFTWFAAQQLANTADGFAPVCYVQLGLPVNAMMVGFEVLFEPQIETEYEPFTELEPDKRSGYALFREARVFAGASKQPRVVVEADPPLMVPKSALVKYITAAGLYRRAVFEDEKVAAIKNCIALFRQQ